MKETTMTTRERIEPTPGAMEAAREIFPNDWTRETIGRAAAIIQLLLDAQPIVAMETLERNGAYYSPVQQPAVLESDEACALEVKLELPFDLRTQVLPYTEKQIAAIIARHRTAHADARVKGLVALLREALPAVREAARHQMGLESTIASIEDALETNESQKS